MHITHGNFTTNLDDWTLVLADYDSYELRACALGVMARRSREAANATGGSSGSGDTVMGALHWRLSMMDSCCASADCSAPASLPGKWSMSKVTWPENLRL